MTITSIEIKNEASYGDLPERLDNLSKFNFIYGANGTGKTTISRVIADEARFGTCKVIWENGRKLETLVYNRDFVENNFKQSIKGIFTLGKHDQEVLDKIKNTKEEQVKLEDEIAVLKKTLEGDDGISGKKKELSDLENEFEDKCWSLKLKYDEQFKEAFRGVRDSKKNFKTRLLAESENNKSEIKKLRELADRSKTVFGNSPQKEPVIPELSCDELLQLEYDPILEKKVVGKSDVDIAAMVEKLGNSDWVKQGRIFYESNDGVCPFCQQATTESFATSLNDYFDKTFEKDTVAIETLLANYKHKSEQLRDTVQCNMDNPSKFLDLNKLKTEKEVLDANIRLNIQMIEKKKTELSKVVKLVSLKNTITTIEEIVKSANGQISKHNTMVDNLDSEKMDLTGQVWKYLLENEIKSDLSLYQSKKTGINKAIESINTQIKQKSQDRAKKVNQIIELEKDTTGIQPTIVAINSLLSSYGFTGFVLAKSEQDRYYKIQRHDGTDAKQTLSEGESSFITFLYFYHLLKGSNSGSSITTDRVVVFDDPVSSLDCDILFIVSNLIKTLFDEIRACSGYIKQIFVLTHNVYFHKEVTYNKNRCQGGAMNEETFWTIKKINQLSKVQKHNMNPIRTSYELLWNEVSDELNRSNHNLTIQNTLRRILEHYFQILGGINRDGICNYFEGEEKIICSSLFSWINDGSHYPNDDIYISNDSSLVDKQLRIFKEIFEKSGHIAHYNMMMGVTNNPSGIQG